MIEMWLSFMNRKLYITVPEIVLRLQLTNVGNLRI